MDNITTTFEQAYLADLNPVPESRFEELKNMYTEDAKQSPNFSELVKNLLMIAIVDEQLAELNYLYSYSLERTEGKTDFDPEFEKHEEEERGHKYDLIQRLRELDANVIFTGINEWYQFNSRGNDWRQEFSEDSKTVILNRLKEEEQAVEFYTLAVGFTRGTDDTTTYTLFKKIKEDEEEHVKDLRDLARDHGFLQ